MEIGAKVLVDGRYPAIVVAFGDNGEYGIAGPSVVVSFTGENGTTPGEQYALAPEDLDEI